MISVIWMKRKRHEGSVYGEEGEETEAEKEEEKEREEQERKGRKRKRKGREVKEEEIGEDDLISYHRREIEKLRMDHFVCGV